MTKHRYPENYKANLLQDLSEEISKYSEENEKEYTAAFRDVALNWLGFDSGGSRIDNETGEEITAYKPDGSSDRGIDFYELAEAKVQIIQSKAFNKDVIETADSDVDSKMFSDVSRIIDYIASLESPKKEQNKQVQKFQRMLGTKLRKIRDGDGDKKFSIRISMLIAASGLTAQAAEEFEELRQSNKSITVFDVHCSIEINILAIDDLLSERWHVTNSDWRDNQGKNRDRVSCQIKGQLISENNVKVFFARALDLINAYNDFGHRIFEANVRCEIGSSKVNQKIEEQVQTAKGIKEFYLLNNGATIVASNISVKDKTVTMLKPGIVNGLQTVTTLSKAYEKLKPELKKVFDEECWVLVRAYSSKVVSEINKLVVATNNQNVMEARNLKSNEAMQIQLERRFAEEGWFYQRKQLAWNAFKSDPDSWPTLKNKKKSNFSYETGKFRVADNIEVARAWMALCGFSKEAMHDQKQLFQDTGNFYSVIFEKRSLKHASKFEFSRKVAAIDENFEDLAPHAKGYLFAFLLWVGAKQLAPSAKQHREKMEAQLKLDGSTTKESIVQQLLEKDEYIKGMIRVQGIFLYIEMVGYLLFEKYGGDLHSNFDNLIRGTDLINVLENKDTSSVEDEINKKRFATNSLLGLTWQLYDSVLDQLVQNDAWITNYRLSGSRLRLLYEEKTRKQIFTFLNKQSDLIKSGRHLNEVWSEHIKDNLADGLIAPIR